MLVLVVAAVFGLDRLSAVEFEVRQDEQGAERVGGAGGARAEFGEGAPGLQVREAVLDGGAAGGFQVLDDVVVAGGGDVVGAPGPRGGDLDQASAFVGEREEVQAVALVLPRIVLAVVLAGAAAGGDEGAVDQHGLPAASGDLGQGAVQARCPGRQQGDDLVGPAADRRGRDAVTAGQVGGALVVAQHGQDDHDDPARRQGRHRDLIAFRCLRSRSVTYWTVLVDSGRAH